MPRIKPRPPRRPPDDRGSSSTRRCSGRRHRGADGGVVGRRRDRLRASGRAARDGPAAIRAAFEAIFANGAVAGAAAEGARLQSLNCAVHSVLERIEITTAEGLQTAWVLATNVYLKSGGGWAMAAHHASPGSPARRLGHRRGPATIH